MNRQPFRYAFICHYITKKSICQQIIFLYIENHVYSKMISVNISNYLLTNNNIYDIITTISFNYHITDNVLVMCISFFNRLNLSVFISDIFSLIFKAINFHFSFKILMSCGDIKSIVFFNILANLSKGRDAKPEGLNFFSAKNDSRLHFIFRFAFVIRNRFFY